MAVQHHVHVALPDGFADRLTMLAARVDRLCPTRNPMLFDRERDDIRRDLVRLAAVGTDHRGC